jgi:hypothetical protein
MKSRSTSSRRRGLVVAGGVLAAVVVLASAILVGSGAIFVTHAANPANVFTAGVLEHSNSHESAAILSLNLMKPGERVSGTVSIKNTGDLSGDFSLNMNTIADLEGANGGHLLDALQLSIRDGSTVVYEGGLKGFSSATLGTYNPGDLHSFEFTVLFPDSGTPLSNTTGDNAYQGSSVTVEFLWNAVETTDSASTTSSTAAASIVDTGWTAPGNYRDVQSPERPVTTPENAYTSDNTYAKFYTTDQRVDYYGFAIAVPKGATIQGIEVEVEGKTSSLRTANVSLSSDGMTFTSPVNLPFTPAEGALAAGNTTELWGRSWSDTDFADDPFTVRVAGTGGGGTLSIDQVRVRVHYLAPATTSTTSGATTTSTTQMLSSTRIAGVGTDDAGMGTLAWGNLNRITVDDTNPAFCLVAQNEVTHYLGAGNFRFSIPAGATIEGIRVDIDRSRSGASPTIPYIQDRVVQLLKAGTRTGDNKAAKDTSWPTAAAVAAYGGATDTWGTTWTSADINDAGFGVSLSVTNVGAYPRSAYVDCVRITVSYTVAGGS